jgi:hypothetical protein
VGPRCGFGLSVGSHDGGEAEAHGVGTVDEKDTGVGKVRTLLRSICRVRSERAKRKPETCRGPRHGSHLVSKLGRSRARC